MKIRNYALFLGTAIILLMLVVPTNAGATRAKAAIWADGKIYDTILTPATFKEPNNQNSLDRIYVVMNLDGQRPIAEAAPYERDYNGGRWMVQAVYFTDLGLSVHDPDHNGIANFEVTSDTQLLHYMTLGYLTITPTNTYFECPLLPA